MHSTTMAEVLCPLLQRTWQNLFCLLFAFWFVCLVRITCLRRRGTAFQRTAARAMNSRDGQPTTDHNVVTMCRRWLWSIRELRPRDTATAEDYHTRGTPGTRGAGSRAACGRRATAPRGAAAQRGRAGRRGPGGRAGTPAAPRQDSPRGPGPRYAPQRATTPGSPTVLTGSPQGRPGCLPGRQQTGPGRFRARGLHGKTGHRALAPKHTHPPPPTPNE